MIITVTVNPCLDKTATLNKIEICELNRLSSIRVDAGGKGVNVSRFLKSLNETCITTGFVGGSNGELLTKKISQENIKTNFIRVDCETRINLKIETQHGELTEFNEPGAIVNRLQWKQLQDNLLKLANKNAIFVLAGSLPRNTNPNVYAQLCSKLKRKGAKVIIDADGQALTESIKAKPDFIKPNLHELCNYFKIKNNKITVNQIALLGKKIIAKGINNLAVSLGSRGSLFFDKHTVIFANALGINIKSTVGAGDSMVAAVAYGLQHKLSWNEIIKLAMAVSGASVETVGTQVPTKAAINQKLKQAKFKIIKGA